RHVGTPYVWISPGVVDARDGRVGNARVQPGVVDWSGLGEWVAFLGPREERRVPLFFQVVQTGLAGRTITLSLTARAGDEDAPVVAEDTMAWQLCHCPTTACRHNRVVHWLPPTGIWDHDELACDVTLNLDTGECLFQGRVNMDIRPRLAPPTPTESAQPEAT